jgi:hypothetical protein
MCVMLKANQWCPKPACLFCRQQGAEQLYAQVGKIGLWDRLGGQFFDYGHEVILMPLAARPLFSVRYLELGNRVKLLEG